MSCTRTLPRLRRYACLALALFAVVLATSQFEHHDIACHLKTPQHCTACAANPLGADPHAPAAPGAVDLADAGCAVLEPHALAGALPPVPGSGRAPPASV